MTGSPYRSAEPDRAAPTRRAALDADLWVGAIVLFVVSVVRVVGALVRRETFGAEATLAAMAMVGVPAWFVAALRARRAR